MDFSLDRPIHDLAEEIRQEWKAVGSEKEVAKAILAVRDEVADQMKKISGADEITNFDVFCVAAALIRTRDEKAVNGYLIFLDGAGVGSSSLREIFNTWAAISQQAARVVNSEALKKTFEDHCLLFSNAANIKS